MGIKIIRPTTDEIQDTLLTAEALQFIEHLQRKFHYGRRQILDARQRRQLLLNKGKLPDFLDITKEIREAQWQVSAPPRDLTDRRVEITGPCERKMMINGLNSGAKVFMADLEDAQSPKWDCITDGHLNLYKAKRNALNFTAENGKDYKVVHNPATLVVRPRGWHLEEAHLTLEDKPLSASIFDFGLYFFHNAKQAIAQKSGPYFYLPKLENHLEARLWNDIFLEAQSCFNLPRGTIKATVLIETILASFEMDEILFELRDHVVGLNAGRWDYIFSMIKRLQGCYPFVLPDRKQVTMTVPFMRAYSNLLVKTCHARGAHAMGGMSAFIPNRKDPEVTEQALIEVARDKEREARDGFDGTWVAHPDLVPVAMNVFNHYLAEKPHQKHVLRSDVQVTARDLLPQDLEGASISETGLRTNIRVAIQYMDSWLNGLGAVALDNLMEDAATAEISRAQIWQWIRNKAALTDGRIITAELYQELKLNELQKIHNDTKEYSVATKLLDDLILKDHFAEFLTIAAYKEMTSLPL